MAREQAAGCRKQECWFLSGLRSLKPEEAADASISEY